MAGLRTTKGDLTADALIAGEIEQWAIDGKDGRITIELFHSLIDEPDVLEMPWVVLVTIKPQKMAHADDLELREYRHFRLKAARKTFAAKVREYR